MYAKALRRAFDRAAALLLEAAGQATVLTGAGISVASGIPAFRGSQGLWDRYDPFEYAEITSFRRQPEKVWSMLGEMCAVVERARPNRAHEVLAELEEKGLLHSLITQNVDGLHQAAGSRKVIEFHGALRHLGCLECDWRWLHFKLDQSEIMPPRCQECGAILKPEVVFFGESIPDWALLEASSEAEKAGVMLVVGTSAEVHPAAEMPHLTKRAGGKVIEINLEPTALSGSLSDLTILGPAEQVLAEILLACERLQGHA
ncbi:MAG: Sir2 family NAD-dependent protein deacetylase [Deltaproteobacteria bacterium]|nr:Sir2 family NAD-dependent protein deacetylase [Deltaproteobacteria bacterium]